MRTPLVFALSPAVALAAGVALAPATASADPAKTSVEQGFELGEIQSPRALAMGGSLFALGTSTTGLYQNPATLPFARMYHLEAIGSFVPEAQRQSYGGAVMDSMTNRLAGGVAYAWTQMDPQGVRREWHDVRVSLAYPVTERFAVGLTGRYLHADQPIARGPFGDSIVSDGTPKGPVFNNVTLDLGLALSISDNLRVGVLGKNLTNTGTGLAPLLAGGGIGFSTKDFSIEVDGLADMTTWSSPKPRVSAGAEVFLLNRVALRAGYRFDGGLSTHGVTFGVGYVDKSWSVELGGRRDLAGTDTPATFLGLGLRYFYNGGSSSSEEAPE